MPYWLPGMFSQHRKMAHVARTEGHYEAIVRDMHDAPV